MKASGKREEQETNDAMHEGQDFVEQCGATDLSCVFGGALHSNITEPLSDTRTNERTNERTSERTSEDGRCNSCLTCLVPTSVLQK
jgi:hypothetical protein